MAKKKITLKEIVNADFGWALSQVAALPLPARAALQISKVVRVFQAAGKEYEEIRIKTLKKYAECEAGANGVQQLKTKPGTKNEVIWLQAENEAAFKAELEELQKEEIEYDSIPFSALGDDLRIEARLLVLLDKVITQEEAGSTPLQVLKKSKNQEAVQ